MITLYTLMGGLGYLSAIIFISVRMKRINLSYKELFFSLILTIVLGFIGARILYAIARIAAKGFSPKGFMNDLLHGGIVFYGGMLGILLGCTIFASITHRKIHDVLDFALPAIPLFHCIARIGCLFAGCCYGVEWSWGVRNPVHSDGLLFPVQIFESACNLLIFISIMIWQRVRRSDRFSAEIYLAAYGICRFILEFFRGDVSRGIWADGLSTSQHISLAILAVLFIRGLVLLIRSYNKKHVKDEKTD